MVLRFGAILGIAAAAGIAAWLIWLKPASAPPLKNTAAPVFQPRLPMDTSGFGSMVDLAPRAKPGASFASIAKDWDKVGLTLFNQIEHGASVTRETPSAMVQRMVLQSMLLHYEGEVARAEDLLQKARRIADSDPAAAAGFRYSVIYYQGVSAMRRGENDNCVFCRGRSACILPISQAAVHRDPAGSEAAISYFLEYLDRFPDDLEIRWLLNLACMTLGKDPDRVRPGSAIPLERMYEPESPMRRFEDISHLVGLDRMNQAGGAIMDDFTGTGTSIWSSLRCFPARKWGSIATKPASASWIKRRRPVYRVNSEG